MIDIRERIARAIDPEAFDLHDTCLNVWDRRQKAATKAAEVAIAEMTTELDALAEKLAMDGVKAIASERQRQIEQEDWTPEHDDEHDKGELAAAASCYAYDPRKFNKASSPLWPWSEAWWKPKDRRSNLVRAGALIAAEIDRLDRATLAAIKEEPDT